MRTSVSVFALLAILLTVSVEVSAQSASPSSGNSWTGFYIGLNAGRAWKKDVTILTVTNDSPNNYFTPAAVPGVNSNGSARLDDNGFTGGGQLGYNHQTGNLLWGGEGDFVSLGLHQFRGGTFGYTTSGSPYQLLTTESTPWLMSVRPRLGWVVDRLLVYGTGGLAVSHTRFQQDFSEGAFTPTPEQLFHTQARVGWTIGTGMEVSFGHHLSGKGEYLFNRFGDSHEIGTLAGANGSSPAAGFVDGATFDNAISSQKIHVVRFGLNFHF